MPTDREPPKVDLDGIVSFSVKLTKEQFEGLQRLQSLCRHDTLQETLVAAMKVYGVHLIEGVMRL